MEVDSLALYFRFDRNYVILKHAGKTLLISSGICGLPSSETIPAFHPRCREMASSRLPSNFRSAMRYTFRPSVPGINRRRSILGEELFTALSQRQDWPKPLPTEIWLIIAGYLTQEFYASKAGRLVDTLSASSETMLDLSSNICIKYGIIEGNRYITSIYNPPVSYTILKERDAPLTRRLNVAGVYLGVRLFYFEPADNHPPSVDPDLWWCQIPPSCAYARVLHDVSVDKQILIHHSSC